LSRELLASDTVAAARALLGARLTRGSGPEARSGRIVEVEAYAGHEDLASHARAGRTKRNAVMFGSPGVAYVYLVYGMHHCLNVVTEADGRAAALLIRAVEPLGGERAMRSARIEWQQRRIASRRPPTAAAADKTVAESFASAPGVRRDPADDRDLTRLRSLPAFRLAAGPALVCAAFSIDRSDDGVDLCDPSSDLRLEAADEDEPPAVATGPRIGIDYAPEPWLSRPWRFYVPGNPSLSTAMARAVRQVAR
jgi:DNA-3-methyladenine glycosylase